MLLPELAPGPLLGIDGGGTKTQFVLADADGSVIALHRGPASYHVDIGVEGVVNVLREGISAVFDTAGLDPGAIAHAFFGLPAFGEDAIADAQLKIAPRRLLGHSRFTCGNDMVCGWAGSLGGADGINVIAGTGSIAYGERAGVTGRCGGWGELFGDEGSAHWIAIEGLRAFAKMSDGRLGPGPLQALMRERLSLQNDLDILARFLSAQCTRTEIATVAPIVTDAAVLGDHVAESIVNAAAGELAQLVVALAAELGYHTSEMIRVSYSGGVIGIGSNLAGCFTQQLHLRSSQYEIVTPLYKPEIGSIILAARASHTL